MPLDLAQNSSIEFPKTVVKLPKWELAVSMASLPKSVLLPYYINDDIFLGTSVLG